MARSHQERTKTASLAAANCTEAPNSPRKDSHITMTVLIAPSEDVITDTTLMNLRMKFPKKCARLALDLKPAG